MDALPFSRSEITIIPHGSRMGIEKKMEEAKGIVIGPGPMDPVRTGLTDIILLCAKNKIPTLGICLGFQAIGMAFGAKLIRTTPVHGKRSSIDFFPSRFFPGFLGMVEVMRYHSLSLQDIKSPLNPVASTKDGIPMAIEHESLPMAGFQFHPDSFATKRGTEMLTSFFDNAL